MPLQAPYAASKWALRAFYDSLRMELAQEGGSIAVSTILPASIDTPLFEHARSKLGAMPKPPPPVYAPEIVADAIVHTAAHPRREVLVGDAAIRFVAAQYLSPAVADAVLSIPLVGASKADRADNATDNLDAPMEGSGQVRGSYSALTLRYSPLTELLKHVPRPGEVLTSAISALQHARPKAGSGRNAEVDRG